MFTGMPCMTYLRKDCADFQNRRGIDPHRNTSRDVLTLKDVGSTIGALSDGHAGVLDGLSGVCLGDEPP